MELQVVLESYDEEKDIITRKGNAKASATRRTKAWQRIADRVNALRLVPTAPSVNGRGKAWLTDGGVVFAVWRHISAIIH